ncbi:LOW QUALITY PROTEIN: uncharacterized protein LOC129590065 [Paramacrobiotus metropolitanus]|uniref:LOW QUALITY PROTEIN: uncharacterized protein LOC129590065 n=1 Tax=Paramacrobiotus metropolitanus TaxID=2943436 RepID=UPI00244592B2|nr:LOW QUALITY PROTEIN: uncharacterized protein LOC129590065 [Paramacrobiotus metropolitanus]
MPPKDAAKKGKAGKGKGADQSAESAPPFVILKEKLPNANWWPTLHLVVENSPVETLLVDLMAEGLAGNGVVTIQKHDLIRETELLVNEHRNVRQEPKLSRREKDKIAKKKAEEEEQRRKEAEEREKEMERQRQAAEKEAQEKGTTGKASTALLKQSKITVRLSSEKTGIKPDSTPVTEAPPPQPRTLLHELIDELQFLNKDVPLSQVFKNPTMPSLVLMVKYKVMMLKRSDIDLFKISYPKHIKLESVKPAPEPLASTDHKKGKTKEPQSKVGDTTSKAPVEKASVMPKDQKANNTSLPKGKPGGGKGKGQADDASDSPEPPPLKNGEKVVVPFHIKCVQPADPIGNAQERVREEIPDNIQRIVRKIQEGEKQTDGEGQESQDPELVPNATPHDMNDDTGGVTSFFRELFVCSAIGTEGLPVLNHSKSLLYATYGTPAFPVTKYQMVRYIVLFGIKDVSFLSEAERQKLPVTSVISVHCLRHRNLPPVRASDLSWIKQPSALLENLDMFWQNTRDLIQQKLAKPESGASGLVVAVKHDVKPCTTSAEYKETAMAAGCLLVELLHRLVHAKVLFKMYNESLDLQHIPKCKMRRTDNHENFRAKEGAEFLDKVQKRLLEQRNTNPEESLALQNLTKNFIEDLRLDLQITGVISETKFIDPAPEDDMSSWQAMEVLSRLSKPAIPEEFPFTGSLKTLLKQKAFALQYNKRWIETILHRLEADARQDRRNSLANQTPNSLAESMKAWNLGTAKEIKIPDILEDEWRFIAPAYSAEHDEDTELSDNENFTELCKMRNFYAVVSYSQKQLSTELALANEQYFHHCVRRDTVTGNVFIIFYAVSNGYPATHIRISETRLHCTVDFPTFCCNIMDEVQSEMEKHVDQTYRCSGQPAINQRFPYGCQTQFAYDADCAEKLGTETVDHLSNYERKGCLKAFIRSNKEHFARRQGWKLKPEETVVMPPTIPLIPTPEPQYLTDTGCETKGAKPSAKKTPAAGQKHETDKLPPCPVPKKTPQDEPFIWNRALAPPKPSCEFAHPSKIPAYLLSNSLSKIKREERRIYCCNTVVSIDRHEFHDGKSALYISASNIYGMNAFVCISEQERSLHLEYEDKTRISVTIVNDKPQLQILDPLGTKTVIGENDRWYCTMSSCVKDAEDAVSVTLFENKAVGLIGGKREEAVFLSPNGNLITHIDQPEDEITKSMPDTSKRFHTKFDHLGHRIGVTIDENATVLVRDESPRSLTKCTQLRSGLRMQTSHLLEGNGEDRMTSHTYEYPGFPRVYCNSSQFETWSLHNGILVSTMDYMNYVILAGVNVVIVDASGAVSLTTLPECSQAFHLEGGPGLIGYPSHSQISFAKQVCAAIKENLNWHRTCSWTRFICCGERVAEVWDLSGAKYTVSESGETKTESAQNTKDGNDLPAPRMFIVSEANRSGSEFVFGEEAISLKYKVLHLNSGDRVRVSGNATQNIQGSFECEITDEVQTEWEYEKPHLLPEELLSDVRALAGAWKKNVAESKDVRFRFHTTKSSARSEQWKKVLFVSEAANSNQKS